MSRLVEPSPETIARAVRRLRQGSIVAFPTETVYGLGASTFDRAALRAVYDLKGRPLDNPLIAHVLDAAAARRAVRAWDERCAALARSFWPGPLTLVLPKAADVPDEATAGLPTIAVRAPRHPVARALLSAFGDPISAPSANRSGHVSPTSAAHVAADFPEAEDLLVLDGGPCAVGLESTVLDLTGPAPMILRAGSVTIEALAAVLGPVSAPSIDAQAESPGTAMHHYAPDVRAEVVPGRDLAARLVTEAEPVAVLCLDAASVPAPHRAIEMPREVEAYAQRLYGALREAEGMGVRMILIEAPAGEGEMWSAIGDRLRRACAR